MLCQVILLHFWVHLGTSGYFWVLFGIIWYFFKIYFGTFWVLLGTFWNFLVNVGTFRLFRV